MRDGRLPHDPTARAGVRVPTAADPWRVLVSGCIAGWGCGVDGTDYGMGGKAGWFASTPMVHLLPFCPEDAGLGTPRTMPDLHGGDGRAVLAGTAKVLDQHGADLTAGMLRGAEGMVAFALGNRVDFALLTDMSGACGTQVVSEGCRFDEPRRYQLGVGVAAAALMAAGVPVVSQRDYATLAWLRVAAEPGFGIPEGVLDHHETEWVREYFGRG